MRPGDRRAGLGGAPEGTRRLDALGWTDRQAPPAHILAGVVRRWSVEGTCQAGRAPLGVKPPRPWSDPASARTTPVLLALGSSVTLVARRLRPRGPSRVQATAGSPQAEPTLADWGGVGAAASLLCPRWGALCGRGRRRAMAA